MLAGAALITAMVLGMVARAFARKPAPPLAESFWIKGLGLGFSFAVLVLVLAAGIWVGERAQPRAGPEVVRVEATARQWAWRFSQPDAHGSMIQTEGRLYIPARRPIDVVIRTEDVIHAFWVPQLAGKMDALPGHDNLLRIEAFAPGIYQGRSAEFSGLGYAGMLFEVHAYDPDAPPPPFEDLEIRQAP